MDNIIVGLAAAVVVALVVIVWKLLSGRVSGKDLPYVAVGAVLSPLEYSFYEQLQRAVGNAALVLCKVRVVDVIKPRSGLKANAWRLHFDRIVQKEFGYVLCNPADMTVFCVIDLDTASQSNTERQKRNEFLSAACVAAEIPMLLMDARQSRSVEELRQQILAVVDIAHPQQDPLANFNLSVGSDDSTPLTGEVQQSSPESFSSVEPQPAAERMVLEPFRATDDDEPLTAGSTDVVEPEVAEPQLSQPPAARPVKKQPLCPKCGAGLKPHKPTTGRFAGQTLLVCSQYPDCRFAAPVRSKVAEPA
ncbi:DUF2726 domain-containing protein [Oceanobacter mangrovi]|uniref:DUF2726 domain-containing protein n=1 Tax=Oceanobacter mangrovi TaxID=2862510 RepID=UPI001C8DF45E|nr:DUF2726 domain-containing protein [Oceanobacter mangrovi]